MKIINKNIHYDGFHGMTVEAGDCSASIARNMVTPLGSLSTLCDLYFDDLLVCTCRNFLFDIGYPGY